MSSDLAYGDRYAETLDEEAQAEFSEDRADDSDMIYDRVRDENTEVLMEDVKKLIEDSKKLWYFKNRKEGLARDIIQFVLEDLKLKIKSVDTYNENFQVINLEEKK